MIERRTRPAIGRYHGTKIRRSRGYAFALTDGKAKSEAKPAETSKPFRSRAAAELSVDDLISLVSHGRRRGALRDKADLL